MEETQYWLELIGQAGIVEAKRLEPMHREADELIAILVTIVRGVKMKGRLRKKP